MTIFEKEDNLSIKAVVAIGLGIWLLTSAVPTLWTMLISVREYVDAFSAPPKLFASFSVDNYIRLWGERAFYKNFLNSLIITGGTMSISLTIGCLAGYALSRYRGNIGFWILVVALTMRALPHSTLLPSYYFVFDALGIRSWRIVLIVVLVSINQPFTIWMLRSFFVNIPKELDEAALVDGCNRLQAFRKVIMPVMWPGVVTTGLFSFLLAYNDFLISSALTDADSQTMPAAISASINADSELLLMEGLAGAVSIIIPLIILIIIFQRQIVSGLTQGAVKG